MTSNACFGRDCILWKKIEAKTTKNNKHVLDNKQITQKQDEAICNIHLAIYKETKINKQQICTWQWAKRPRPENIKHATKSKKDET